MTESLSKIKELLQSQFVAKQLQKCNALAPGKKIMTKHRAPSAEVA